jgi:hypothetical protein
MGFKSFTNTHAGRASLTLTGLVALAIAIALYTFILYYPESTRDVLQNELQKASSSWDISEVKLVDEEKPLPDLPSLTLAYNVNEATTSAQSSELESSPVGFPFIELSDRPLDSLVNVSTALKNENSSPAAKTYSFKFYSGSLKDYEEGGAYRRAVEQFLSVQKLGLDNLDFVSKPSSSGGREVTVDGETQTTFRTLDSLKNAQTWNNAVKGLTEERIFKDGTLIRLSLSDSEKVTVKTVLTSAEDRDRATNFAPELWSTFSSYAYDSALSFLNASKVEYTVERTPEDSTLVVTTAPEAAAIPELEKRLYSVANDSEGKILVIWSYNTYFVTPDNPAPYFMLDSSSRVW